MGIEIGIAICGAAAVAGSASAGVGPLHVISHEPAAHALSAPVDAAISVRFDRPVDPATIDDHSFWAFGRWSGTVSGTFSFAQVNQVVTLTPSSPFSAGEQVTVILSHDIHAYNGTPFRSAGHTFQFWTAAAPAAMQFEQIAEMTTRTSPGTTSRAYGGIGSDLNNDGFLDLTIVNEDTADLRVFLNAADGSGACAPFLQPTFPVGLQASPSEPADFDRDGNTDICVANISADTVSILLGNGDGTYAPQQLVTVGDAPRGIAVLDADGDGDLDIVNTNSFGSGSMSLLVNDGAGVFSAPGFFEAGATGERALAATDMDEDGIMDLIIGAQGSQSVVVSLGIGSGLFTFASSTPAGGGGVWMIVCGDVNGDGHADVASVNASSSNGAIFLGDGNGGLAAPVTVGTDPFPLATDLGDLDGDGDLDWITSSYNGDWFVFRNDGAGGFAFDQGLPSPIAASCSIPLDLDDDGDLDLALVDELADVVILMRNLAPPPCPADLDGSGAVGFADLLLLLGAWGPCPADCPADLDASGAVGFADVLMLLGAWGGC